MIVLTEFQSYGIGNLDGDGLWDGNFQWVEINLAFTTQDEEELDEMSLSLTYRGIDHVKLLITNEVRPYENGWGVFTKFEVIEDDDGPN